MSNYNQSWTSIDDFFFYFLLFAFIILPCLFFCFWFVQHDICVIGIIYFFHFQIKVLSFFTSTLAYVDHQLYIIDISKITLYHIWSIQEIIGYYYRFPVLILTIIAGLLSLNKTISIIFRRKINLQKFMQIQAKNFPILNAFSKNKMTLCHIDPTKPLINDPALKLDEWINTYATSFNQFDIEKAKAELVLQLGERWNGVEKASPIIRVLYTAFSLHLNNKSNDAQKLLKKLAQEVSDENIPITSSHKVPENIIVLADDLRKKIKNLEKSKTITDRHAWSNTALMSLLDESRKQSGVLPPSFFLVIKLIDRRMWYALHSLGFPGKNFRRKNHPNPCIEAAGARAHWEKEIFTKKALVVPQISIVLETIHKVS